MINKKLTAIVLIFFGLALGKTGQILYEEYYSKRINQKATITAPISAPEPVPAKFIPEGWQKFYPGGIFAPPSSSGISFLSPCMPIYEKVDAIEKSKDRIIQYDHYVCSSNELSIIYYWVWYDEGISVDLKEAIDSLDKQFKFRIKTLNPIVINDYKGQLLTATYENKKGSGTVKGVLLSEKSEVWSIIINYPLNSNSAANTVQRIVDSIEITKIGIHDQSLKRDAAKGRRAP
ncbi:MAG: hypothetical protein M1147_02770 [Nitrospirae bacterium]|nr:hypothetical protein [Nitrospirota bacterium]MCL5977038.1 hypothetical protein [Nitrospirota bacterium]